MRSTMHYLGTLILLLGIAVLQAQSQFFPPPGLSQIAMDFRNGALSVRCRQQANATETDVNTMIVNQTVPNTSAGQCLLACAAREIGMLRDNIMSREAAANFTSMFFPSRNDSIFRQTVQDAVNGCSGNSTGPPPFLNRFIPPIMRNFLPNNNSSAQGLGLPVVPFAAPFQNFLSSFPRFPIPLAPAPAPTPATAPAPSPLPAPATSQAQPLAS